MYITDVKELESGCMVRIEVKNGEEMPVADLSLGRKVKKFEPV